MSYTLPKRKPLTEGKISERLFKMALPICFGIFAAVAFNLIDTLFVAQLGTAELAAINFTFPVVMFMTYIGIGIGTASVSLVSRAIGAQNDAMVRRYATDSLLLTLVISVGLTVIGLLTIDPLFILLGANDQVLALIRDYMEIWYLGVFTVIFPMVASNTIRSTGDAKTPAMIMIVMTMLNLILDPILIFGLLSFPQMGLKGAAIATVFARSLGVIGMFVVLHKRDRMLIYSIPHVGEMIQSWRDILYIALPSMLSNFITPAAIAIAMRVVAPFGAASVAAIGAGLKVEAVALVVLMATCAALIPVVGQNWGAKQYDRARKAKTLSYQFSMIWGVICVVIFFVFGKSISHLFSVDETVVQILIQYLWIVPVGYGLLGVFQIATSVLNAIHRPIPAAAIKFFQFIVIFLPCIILGAEWYGIKGMIIGVLVSHVLGGALAYFMTAVVWKQELQKVK